MKTIKSARKCSCCGTVLWTTPAELTRHEKKCPGTTAPSAYQKRKNGGRNYRDKRGHDVV